MSELRFDGRTAIVTGAGGNPGLGRAYAMLLAARGANVVVNDIGFDPEAPEFPSEASAQAVVDEIRALGGNAVADTHSVAIEEGARATIQTALDAFGSVDILVNNACFGIGAPFGDYTSRDFQKHIEVQLMGYVWTTRAAWPHMRSKGYGRIVNMGSGAIAGMRSFSAFSASAGGVFTLTRTLATEGGPFGIKVNTVNAGAFTRGTMASLRQDSQLLNYIKPLRSEVVAPVVAYLAHKECPVSGECFHSIGGVIHRVTLMQTPGFVDPEPTIETVQQRWSEVMDVTGATIMHLPGYDLEDSAKPYHPEERMRVAGRQV
jgi:NAD(P)-dependent dehydrogenase (short-subunit alcohol dehydrogenase family)